MPAGKAAHAIESAWRDGGEAQRAQTESPIVAFIKDYPTDPKTVTMWLRLAWLRVSQSRLAEAARMVETYAASATGVEADWVGTIQGAMLRRRGKPDQALEKLLALEDKIVDVSLRDLWSAETARAALEASRIQTAIMIMTGFRANGNDEHLLQTQSEIEELLLRIPTERLALELDNLSKVAQLPVAEESTRQARNWMLETVRGHLASDAVARSDALLARRLLKSAPTRFVRGALGEQLRDLANQVASTVLSMHAAIGLLLETQDDFASRRSAELVTGAMQALGTEENGTTVRLINREARATTDAAIVEGLGALVSDGAAIVIAGVTRATQSAAIALAESKHVVVIALSSEPGEPGKAGRGFGVEELASVVARQVQAESQGGPTRVTMQSPICQETEDSANQVLAHSREKREFLLLTDEVCANRVADTQSRASLFGRVWLGAEAVASVARFDEVTLMTSPKLGQVESSPAMAAFQAKFERIPFWYEALGYDIVGLAAQALLKVGVDTVVGADAIERRRAAIAAALARAKGELLTSSASGFNSERQLAPTIVAIPQKLPASRKKLP